MNSYVQLEISTAGFQIESSHIYSGLKSIIFVIDLLGDYIEALTELCSTIVKVRRKGFLPNFDIFLHKADGLSASEQKGMVYCSAIRSTYCVDVFEELSKKAREEVEEICGGSGPSLNFYLTSLYDHSILLAISKVIGTHIMNYFELQAVLDNFRQVSSRVRF